MQSSIAELQTAFKTISVNNAPTIEKPKTKSFSEIAQANVTLKLTKNPTANNNTLNSNKNSLPSNTFSPETTLVLANANDPEKCSTSTAFQFELSKIFPKIKMTSFNIKPNGLIFMHFTSNDEAKKVVNGWKPSYFGKETTINFIRKRIPELIVKNVPTDLTETDIQKSINTTYPNIKNVTRFTKNNNPIPVIKLTFSQQHDADQCLANGITIENLFLQPEICINNRYPSRCYKCSKYGHSINFCKNKKACSHCAGEHDTSECDATTFKKCANCSGNHNSFDKACPKFLELFSTLNNRNNFL